MSAAGQMSNCSDGLHDQTSYGFYNGLPRTKDPVDQRLICPSGDRRPRRDVETGSGRVAGSAISSVVSSGMGGESSVGVSNEVIGACRLHIDADMSSMSYRVSPIVEPIDESSQLNSSSMSESVSPSQVRYILTHMCIHTKIATHTHIHIYTHPTYIHIYTPIHVNTPTHTHIYTYTHI